MITIIVLAVVLCAIYFLFIKNRIFVHLKTGNKYLMLLAGKLKNPDSGNWNPCVFYMSLKDFHCYARETYDFFDKFKKKSEYKN